MNTERPFLSIVIPLYNEAESLPELEAWIRRVVEAQGWPYEIIFVDDGSTDGSWDVIQQLAQRNPHIRAFRFQRNYGKSAALHVGFREARGRYIITMDADLQDSPDEIVPLVEMMEREGYDLISGWKKERHDPLSKTIPSKFFNWVTRRITGIPLHDFNCGLKIYRARTAKSLDVHGEMHRYLPAMAKWAGFSKIGEKVVRHYPRKYGTTKFGLERFINGFLDLLSMTFVQRFRRRPMHFFGTLGVIVGLVASLIIAYLVGNKLYHAWILQQRLPREIVDMPLFYIALTAVIIGFQLFLAGFLGELVASHSSRDDYHIMDAIDRSSEGKGPSTNSPTHPSE